MRTLFLIAIGFLAIAAVNGQTISLAIPPAPQPVYPQLKAYLNLTDAQLQNLLSVQTSRNTAQQAIYKQINEKQMQLNTLLSQGTSDALAVGQLEIDINSLRKQLPLPNSPYRAMALAVLTPDQTARLPGLVSALQLQSAAWQAITLDLIDALAPGGPLPVPVMPPMGLGVAAAAQ